MRGVPSSTPPLPPNTKHVKDARIPLPVAWRRCLQCCSMPRANRGVLSRGPSQVLRKKALGLSNMRRHCVWVKDDDCGTLAESAAAPAADRESVTSKQSGGLRGSRPDPVYNLDRQRAVAEKMQSRSAVIETAIIMILPAGIWYWGGSANFALRELIEPLVPANFALRSRKVDGTQGRYIAHRSDGLYRGTADS